MGLVGRGVGAGRLVGVVAGSGCGLLGSLARLADVLGDAFLHQTGLQLVVELLRAVCFSDGDHLAAVIVAEGALDDLDHALLLSAALSPSGRPQR